MIVKPSISFLISDSDADLITDVGSINTGMTGNPNYANPTPPLPVVAGALSVFSNALNTASNGGKALTSAKDDARDALAVLVRELASYVQVACKGDLTILLSSGFPVQKPTRSPIGELPAPANLTVTLGAHSGELDASASPVSGAAIYNWRVATAAQPTVLVQTEQTTAASATFDGLTPGVVYNIQANAVGSAGPSDWTSPVSQMVV
jgi:hypothetical protein